ncbi:MAG: RNA polymerase sigma factor [Candidatus Kapaibacteriales bacterium]
MINFAIKLISDDEIIRQYEVGDLDFAALQLVLKYKNFVYLTAFRYVKNHFDAEDLTQDVFIKALEKINSFRKGSSLKTWLYRITVNFAKNHLRRKKIISAFSFFSANDQESVENIEKDIPMKAETHELEMNEVEEIFLKAVASLPEKQREVFALRFFDELDYQSISELLGTSVGGLKANYFHAIKKIAKQMEKFLEE